MAKCAGQGCLAACSAFRRESPRGGTASSPVLSPLALDAAVAAGLRAQRTDDNVEEEFRLNGEVMKTT